MVERLAFRWQRRQLGEDATAALRLLAQQAYVLGERRIRLDGALEFGRDHGDGGERRAELMRSSGGEAVELRKMLLARQHQLGGGEGIRQLACLLGQLPRMHANEA